MQSNTVLASSAEQRREQRYPCVGIALIYSPLQSGHVHGFGGSLHRAALSEMSLRGLSFDVDVPLATGDELFVLIAQPDGAAHERLRSTVRWCEKISTAHYRVGVYIEATTTLDSDVPGKHITFPIGRGPAMPVGAELPCPSCNTHTTFQLIGQQSAGDKGEVMPLYDCTACGTTRSITGILAHSRQLAAGIKPSGAERKSLAIPPLKRILYAEDETDIQAVAKLALEMVGGYSVSICSTGKEALRTATKLTPDMILLDVMMPGMDGPATLRALRELPLLRDVPVIFMTDNAQPQAVANYKSMGACNVISKPFDPMTLANQVRAIWEQHHNEQARQKTNYLI